MTIQQVLLLLWLDLPMEEQILAAIVLTGHYPEVEPMKWTERQKEAKKKSDRDRGRGLAGFGA